MLNCLWLLITFTLWLGPVQSETRYLTEAYLFTLAIQGSPRLDEIEATFLNAKVLEGEISEEFAPEFFGKGSYSETNEKALVTFQPVFTPVSQAQLGVRQAFRNGLLTQASIVSDQRSSASSPFAGKFRDSTTTVLSFTMQLDVWKNLFGRLSKARIEYADLQARSALLQKEIQSKVFVISLRRLYWSLVANQEAMKISEGLLNTARKQAADAGLRYRNAVADIDEVVRYDAQVSSRHASILYLKYQRETLLKQLRNLLPQLVGEEIQLGDYDIAATMDEVMECAVRIGSVKNIPYENTRYDELLLLLRNMRENRRDYNSRYARTDVKLFGTVKTTGISNEREDGNTYRGSYGGSFDDITGSNRSGYEVGLLFTLPLGSVKDNAQKTRELYDEKKLSATIDNTDTQIINTHLELVKSIKLLNEVIKNQRLTSGQLGKRLAGMKKKYRLGRVSVNDLIMDQDALFNADLTTIETQLQMLSTLFDYFVIFPDTPCSFNRNHFTLSH